MTVLCFSLWQGVWGHIRAKANQLVADAEIGGSFFKKRNELTFGLREAIGKFKTIVDLHALDSNALLFDEGLVSMV